MLINPAVRAQDEHHCIATWDRVLIQLWRKETPLETVANLDKIARTFLASESRGVSSLAIIESTATPPSDLARSALSKFYREVGSQMKAAVVVAEGGGFRAAFVRGVGLTLSTLAPRTLPFKFVGSVKEATELIAPHMSPASGGSEGLRRAIDELRMEIAKVGVGAAGAERPRAG